MNLESIFSSTYSFFETYPWLALVIIVVLAIFLWKEPWMFLKFALGILALIAGIYVFSFINESAFVGSSKKTEITTEREERLFNE